MELLRPTLAMLPAYRDALARGFTPSNVDSDKARRDHLAMIDSDPHALIAQLHDPDGKAPPFVRSDGQVRERLPGLTRWMWEDGEFVGAINLRWQPGTGTLPPQVPGHIGYIVAQWHRDKGHATAALLKICAEARRRGLAYVELTTEDGNHASRRTIEKAGGRIVGRFDAGDLHHPCAQALLWRIDL